MREQQPADQPSWQFFIVPGSHFDYGWCASIAECLSYGDLIIKTALDAMLDGDEDFASPERHGHSLADRVREQIGPEQAEVAQRAWEGNCDQHNEICDTLQPGAWGYTRADDGNHIDPDDVLERLASARAQNCNLLLNTGPLPDGAIHHEDAATLREVGRRLRMA